MKDFFQKYGRLILGGVILISLYLITHLQALILLPVFADEAIYIRWAQLIQDDWKRYLFFPMNDGKTPLFVWISVGALSLWEDPLYATRMISVIAGLFQIWVTFLTVKKLGGQKIAQAIAIFSVSFLPFWYFHQRMALMDSFLTLMLSTSFYFLLKAVSEKKADFRNTLFAGTFLGLALFTKIPAILFFPALFLAAFLPEKNTQSLPVRLRWMSGTLLMGLLIFLSLKLTPLFGQLFSRGGDFLYPIPELFEKGVFTIFWSNLQRIGGALFQYLSWPIVILPFFGIFQEKLRRKHILLLLSFLGFILPILILGKTIYPRYILPSLFPLTLSAALSFEYIFRKAQENVKKPLGFFLQTSFIIFALVNIVQTATFFLLISWQNPNYLPFTAIDRVQYVIEWSSGHGIKETTELILAESKKHSLAVATEGYFGTLPDGILLYLHDKDVTGLKVEGVGQPVHEIPESFRSQAQAYEKTWLVVNSHREKMYLATRHPDLLVKEFCRIGEAPCLQIWDITSLIQNPEK